MPEETDDYLNGILDAKQQIENIAKTLFEKCPTCDDILGYLMPQSPEETRHRTEAEIEAIIGSEYKNPFNYLVSHGFLNNPRGNTYALSDTGRVFAVHAKPVGENLRI